MPKYIVFDVETPNRYNNRMSAIGISIVENGKIVKSFFSYVDPEQSFDLPVLRHSLNYGRRLNRYCRQEYLWRTMRPLIWAFSRSV